MNLILAIIILIVPSLNCGPAGDIKAMKGLLVQLFKTYR